MNGGAQESGRRAGTENVASIVGMATALEENTKQLKQNHEYLLLLERLLIKELVTLNVNFMRNGSIEHLAGCISLSFPNMGSETLLHRLDLKGICISSGSACNSKSVQISHVLKAIGLNNSIAKNTIRISLGKHNSIEEVRYIASEIAKATKTTLV